MKTFAPPRKLTFGPLRAVEFPASEGAPVIVCFHGYGADGADLAPLSGELDVPVAVRWLFPDGPMKLPAYPSGRAWWPIDEERLRRAQIGQRLDISGSRPDGLDKAIATAEGFLKALEVPWDRLILGGFSQGAMLALELALRAPEAPKGLFLLSSTLVDEANVVKLAPGRAGLKVFQSHGEQDPLLSFDTSRRLHDLLVEAGLEVRFTSFSGGHALPREALERLEGYLADILAPAEKEAE